MTGAIQKFVRSTDEAIARVYLSLFKERNALLPFLFHSLFRDEREIELNLIDPLDRTTIAKLRQFIEYYLDCGYRFVSPPELLAGLDPSGRYAMITFDDGYYNNTLAQPVLREFGVPALFFISTTHVRENKCYWWDVLYRERTLQGVPHDCIESEARTLKQLRTEEIESRLQDWFGADALKPRGDIDRPFSPAELKAFASDPRVFLGNHTANHAILINYTPQEIREQILGAQEALHEMIGVDATAIAYPNGAVSDHVVDVCVSAGLKLGFTVRPEKRILPIDLRSNHTMRLGRFTPHSHSPIPDQCRTYRSDVLLYGKFRDLYLRLQGEARVTN